MLANPQIRLEGLDLRAEIDDDKRVVRTARDGETARVHRLGPKLLVPDACDAVDGGAAPRPLLAEEAVDVRVASPRETFDEEHRRAICSAARLGHGRVWPHMRLRAGRHCI